MSGFGRGVIFALGGYLSLVAMILLNRYALVELRVGVAPLMLAQLFFGGALLIGLSGRGWWDGLRRFARVRSTWIVGGCRAANWLLYLWAIKLISVTEAEFLLKWSLVAAVALAALTGGALPRGAMAWLGLAIVATSLLAMSATAPADGFLLILGAACFVALEGAAAERHPGLTEARGNAGDSLFAGAMMWSAGLLALVGFGLGSLTAGGGALFALSLTADDWAPIALALVGGAILRAGFAFGRFAGLRLTGNVALLAVGAAIPFLTIVIETALDRLGVLRAPTLALDDLAVGSIAATGGALMIAARLRREGRAGS